MSNAPDVRKENSRTEKAPSLFRTIFVTFLLFVVGVLLVETVGLSLIFYDANDRVTEDKLLAETQSLSEGLEGKSSKEKVKILSDELTGLARYTLIAPNGRVLYDSSTDASTMENHADRPEVAMAYESGDAVALRFSKTFGVDTMYAAVQLDDGSVLRLAQDHKSSLSFLYIAMLPLGLALVLFFALSLFITHGLARSILRPIDELDVANPHENDVYAEMQPLIEKISVQQERLVEQNRELIRVDGMRRDFSSNVSHDMKTPVHAISGYAELLKSGMASPEDVKTFAGVIYDEAQVLRKLIDDVLMLSRLDEPDFDMQDQRIINMGDLANRVCGRLSFLAREKEVSISCNPAGIPVHVCGNEQMLEEMTCNLIENAIKYNKRGGMVRVKVGVDEDKCILRVSDTGVGIPEELRDKIFQRFYRLEKSRSKETGGTGLGLAIVKHVVMRHGGSIDLESDESLGSVFTVSLPLLDDSSDETL